MNLEFFEGDLNVTGKNKPTKEIEVNDLQPQAQSALMIVKRGTFYRNKGTPKQEMQSISVE